jgi:Bardet-Biedl syndrome 4 protein
LDPFEWIISYNLGLVYLYTKQYASAFHYMNAASNYKNNLYLIFMYLGIILANLDDIYNAINYFDKALELQPHYLVYYNYIVALTNHQMFANAKEKYEILVDMMNNIQNEEEYDSEIKNTLGEMKSILYTKKK